MCLLCVKATMRDISRWFSEGDFLISLCRVYNLSHSEYFLSKVVCPYAFELKKI